MVYSRALEAPKVLPLPSSVCKHTGFRVSRDTFCCISPWPPLFASSPAYPIAGNHVCGPVLQIVNEKGQFIPGGLFAKRRHTLVGGPTIRTFCRIFVHENAAKILEPLLQVESHLYQTMQYTGWICTRLRRITAYKCDPEFEKFHWAEENMLSDREVFASQLDLDRLRIHFSLDVCHTAGGLHH